MNGNAEEFGDLFREHTKVHQHHLMPNKEILKIVTLYEKRNKNLMLNLRAF